MSDAVLSAGVGAAAIPALAAFGIDPESMIAGLLGCIVIQSLMPEAGRSLKSLSILTLGSVLFASLVTPLMAPWVMKHLAEASMPSSAVRAACAAAAGAFAQPIVVGIRQGLVPALINRWRILVGSKETPDA